MDEIDAAQRQEELLLNTALANRVKALKSPNGMCIWCHDEPIVTSSAFCSADCGEDYGKRQREMKQRRNR